MQNIFAFHDRVAKDIMVPRTQINFQPKNMQDLSVKLPKTECKHFQPFIYLLSPIYVEDVMVVGKRKPFLNSKVDVKRLQRYEEQFKAFQRNFI